jgi:hypothetical protein
MTDNGRIRTCFKLVAVGFSVVLCSVILEGVIRTFRLAPPLPEQYRDFVRDPHLPFMPKPNMVRRGTSGSREFDFEFRHNSQGLRDEEHTIAKPDDVFRILALGDSFTWGVGADYEETFLYRLERRLNQRGPGHKRVEIIKAGVARFFPKIERLLLEHYGIEYDPDLVLVAFTYSDLKDTVRGLDTLRPTSKEGFLITQRGERIGTFGTWLFIHSHAARVGLNAYFSLTDVPSTGSQRHRDTSHAEREEAWAKIEREYDRMYDIAHKRGADLVVVNIPRLDLEDRPSEYLSDMIDRKPYHFIDVLPDMADAVRAKPERLFYWPIDHHCTPDGYAVIADTLFREFTRRKLVP